MKLTRSQEARIGKYLKDVTVYLGDVSEEERKRAIAQLKNRIARELRQFGDGDVDDGSLEVVLENCGNPVSQAARLLAGRASAAPVFLAWPDRVWLGVCGGLGRALGVEPGVVRLIAVLLAVIFPLVPILLLGYITAFLVAYFRSPAEALPRVAWGKMVQSFFGFIGTAVALFAGSLVILLFITHMYRHFMGQELVVDPRWAWLIEKNRAAFAWCIAILGPLAIIRALPTRVAWQKTLKKVTQAGLALYAMGVCFGIASLMVGIILLVVDQVSGGGGIEAIQSLF
ncbi:MAG: PspC domain-containing protein [bacterium]|nr:PspC domain-containing protein [bacterium]